jgi:hypothetical protein
MTFKNASGEDCPGTSFNHARRVLFVSGIGTSKPFSFSICEELREEDSDLK